MSSPSAIGEVVAATTTYFTAQCTQVADADSTLTSDLPDPPSFGSFVRIGPELHATPPVPGEDFDPFESAPPLFAPPVPGEAIALYGVVFQAETGSLEPGRLVTAYGLDEAELRRSQPQIFELLATRFSAALIAYAGLDGVVRPFLPPRPPRPHAQVCAATTDETRRLTVRLDYLRPLLAGGSAGAASYPPDELVAALLRNACHAAHPNEAAFLLRAGRELATLLPMDYDRLRALIGRITG